jgi:transcriptional antiterminator RfaH
MDCAMTEHGAATHGARPSLGCGERWYVATTLPRKERVAEANLAKQNYRNFLPIHLETRRHARKFRTVLAPVFPSYIFVVLDVGQHRWRSVNGTLGVQRLIMDGERPLAVAPGVVETLIQSSDRRGALIYRIDDLAIGDRVELVAGPFAGSLGVLQRLDGDARVQVLLNLLGGAVKATVGRRMVAAAR